MDECSLCLTEVDDLYQCDVCGHWFCEDCGDIFAAGLDWPLCNECKESNGKTKEDTMSQKIMEMIEYALEDGNLESCVFCGKAPEVKYIINRKGDMDYDPLANIYTAKKLREYWDQCREALGVSYFAISCKDMLCPGHVSNIRPAKDAMDVMNRWQIFPNRKCSACGYIFGRSGGQDGRS